MNMYKKHPDDFMNMYNKNSDENLFSDIKMWLRNFGFVMAYFACVYASRFYFWVEPALLKIQLLIKKLKVRLIKFFRNFNLRQFLHLFLGQRHQFHQ